MPDDILPIANLIVKDIQGELSEQERLELQAWLNASESNRQRYEQIVQEDNILESVAVYGRMASRKTMAWSKVVLPKEEGGKVVSFWLFRRYPLAIATAVIVALAASAMWTFNHFYNTRELLPEKTVVQQQDVPPGGNKAVLTLANGARIVLDSAQQGSIAAQGGIQVVKLDSGEIAYRHTGIGTGEALYNTISTPRGGQYKVILPDGSKVWLNAATSIRYQTAFSGPARSVELTGGEAYFEVARHASQPFTVLIHPARQGDQELAVNVLGTGFDINAYSDEPTLKTTLLDGSIKLARGSESVLLHPGEQAQITSGDPIKVIQHADIESVIAWKNGYFQFSSDDIETIMRQIARWYDVDVVYEGEKSTRHFTGDIGRNSNVSGVLELLELNQVHFRVEGKKIIVMQ